MVRLSTRRPITIIHLPGILAKADTQIAPVFLEDWGVLDFIRTPDLQVFRPEHTVDVLTKRLVQLHLQGRNVVLIGSSLGGILAAMAVQRLGPQWRYQTGFQWLRVIAVDSPAGAGTFKGFEWVPDHVWRSPGLLTAIGAPILWVGRMGPGLPKDGFIAEPDPDTKIRMSYRAEEPWNTWLRAEAKRGLQGHRPSVWAQQLCFMARVFNNGQQWQAVRALRDVDFTYLQCTAGNDVVAQPVAAQWWAMCADMDDDAVVQVEAPHCGYLQMQPAFSLAFEQVLSRPWPNND